MCSLDVQNKNRKFRMVESGLWLDAKLDTNSQFGYEIHLLRLNGNSTTKIDREVEMKQVVSVSKELISKRRNTS